jgi:hypothetical protein
LGVTSPPSETIERERAQREREAAKLYITDAELIRWLGVPEKRARMVIRQLDAQHRVTGFPQKQKLWGDRRYMPALKAWFDKQNGLK